MVLIRECVQQGFSLRELLLNLISFMKSSHLMLFARVIGHVLQTNAYCAWPMGGRARNVIFFTSYNSLKLFFVGFSERAMAGVTRIWIEM